MADGLTFRRAEKDSAGISENGSDLVDTIPQDSKDDTVHGCVEDRFRVDRKKLEQMLQGNWEHREEAAEDFFQRIMDETNTQISWPSKLKIGAKSKKDPHIKVVGQPDDVKSAKDLIMAVLDTKSNRATLKMDVSHTDHSHVIGKGGNNIKRVMQETGCHVHFPDSNRGNNVQEKSNQVSIAGPPQGVEAARIQIRELLPLVFMFEIPVTPIAIQLPDIQSPSMQQFQAQYNITVSYRQRARMYPTTVIVRGSVYNEKQVKEATMKLMELLLGTLQTPLPLSMQLEIAPQHHLFIIGRGGINIKQIMQSTAAAVHFPDPNTVSPQRKGTVYITGTIESVYQARQQLIGYLPLVLMFDVKEEIDMDQGRISQLMEQLDVFISVKPKPKQPSKSVIVKSIERNANNMYLARLLLLGIEKVLPRQPAITTPEGAPHNVLTMTALDYFGQNLQHTLPQHQQQTLQQQPLQQHSLQQQTLQQQQTLHQQTLQQTLQQQTLQQQQQQSLQQQQQQHLQAAIQQSIQTALNINTANQLLLVNGTKSPQATTPSTASPRSPHSPRVTSPNHFISPPPGIYGPRVMLQPGTTSAVQNALDLMSKVNLNGLHKDVNQNNKPYPQVPSAIQREQANSRSDSEANSPSRSPCESPHSFRENTTAVNLNGLSNAGSFGNLVSSHPPPTLSSSGHTLDLLGLTKTSLNSSGHTMDLLGLSKTTNPSMSSLNMGFLNSSLSNGSLHGSLNRSSLTNGDDRGPLDQDQLDLRAPGIERKNSMTNMFADVYPQYGVDYEQKKLLANKAMQKKPIGESRIPTDFWSGLGFSKSMPESAIRERMAQQGIKQRYESPMATTYENVDDELPEIDNGPWNNSVQSSFNRPINPAPGEFPSPRKKYEYGLSASNHIDGALVPNKSYWSPKTDLAELFIKLGLSKYADLFQQQEIDLSTFLTLTDPDLRELGISTFGARRKMLLAIADLNKRRMLLPNTMEDSNPFHDNPSPRGSHPDLSTLGIRSDSSGLGSRSDLSGLGSRSDLSCLGSRSDLSGLGSRSEHSGLGSISDLTGLGNRSDLTGLGNRSEMSGLGSQSDLGKLSGLSGRSDLASRSGRW